jgi:hypothetical protein
LANRREGSAKGPEPQGSGPFNSLTVALDAQLALGTATGIGT